MMKPRNSERVQFSHHPNRGKKKKKRGKKGMKTFPHNNRNLPRVPLPHKSILF